MAGFNHSTRTKPAPAAFTMPAAPTGVLAPTVNHEGTPAFTRGSQHDLFLLGVSFMVGEPTFYEDADERIDRFRALIRACLWEDPVWTARFIGALRSTFNVRTAAVVAAAEFALAVRELPADAGTGKTHRASREQIVQALTNAGITVRSVVSSALQRADEPADFIAYWKIRTGKRADQAAVLPGGVQRGVADAVTRLVNERSALKYDGNAQAIRLGDVIEVTHPKAKGPWQDDLFAYLLGARHRGGDNTASLARLPVIGANRIWRMTDREHREEMLAALIRNGHLERALADAGMTWEELGGWLGRPIGKGEWEALIPSMGYMALLRHLREFDEKGVAAGPVIARLTDPQEVARSRQFPYRFLSAYRAVPSDRWNAALEVALNLACANIPAYPGRTLVLVDTSGSMNDRPISERSRVTPAEIAALFAGALSVRARTVPGSSVDLVGFATGVFDHPIPKGGSVLKLVTAFTSRIGVVGHGTNIPAALARWDGHDRVILFSDMQTLPEFGSGRTATHGVPDDIPIIGFNLGGYASTVLDTSRPGRAEIGGFTDAAFRLVAILEDDAAAAAALANPREVEA